MFVQSKKFLEAHGGKLGDISVFGQEWNPTTWRLAKMNLAIRGIEAKLGPEWANSFQSDLHKGLKADEEGFEAKMKRLVGKLGEQFAEGARLEREIGGTLGRLQSDN
jgi:type I restriction-modification system DNA methylase subunit